MIENLYNISMKVKDSLVSRITKAKKWIVIF